MRHILWLAVLLFAAPLIAAERPAITAQSDGQSIAIKPATTLPYTWVCIDKGDGKFAGVLAVVDGGKPVTWIYQLAIDAPGPTPTPTPNPAPTPTPTPTPAKVAFVYLLHESKDSTPAFNAIVGDEAWKKALEANGVKWATADVDSAGKSLPNAVDIAKKAGLPALVWLDAAGLAKAEKCPQTPAEVMAKLKAIGAVK
jgi:hypothetical protein